MKEKQRQDQETKVLHSDSGDDPGGLSEEARTIRGRMTEVDTMIDSILSSATSGSYLETIRQRGGQ